MKESIVVIERAAVCESTAIKERAEWAQTYRTMGASRYTGKYQSREASRQERDSTETVERAVKKEMAPEQLSESLVQRVPYTKSES